MIKTSFAAALIALTFSVAPANAQSVPIESGATISDTSEFPRAKMISLTTPGAVMIRAMGWRCDSISAIRPYLLSRGFTMTCNQYNYTYEFQDKGGNWVVNLK